MEKKKVTKAELEFLDNAAMRIVANGSHFPEHAYNHAERLLEERRRRYEISDFGPAEEKQK
ncbi:hypothetical protein [Flavobacterium lindanitolerans]|uniref:hypothetical protein n=1 Tax=Flavobacterium lindanitolerans TaxID=428988 RepID=UPI0023F4253D|nr:hypothetical protein [Flavobacterium lindanitolerans]